VFNKLQDKKYLRFSFDSPTYILKNNVTKYVMCVKGSILRLLPISSLWCIYER